MISVIHSWKLIQIPPIFPGFLNLVDQSRGENKNKTIKQYEIVAM